MNGPIERELLLTLRVLGPCSIVTLSEPLKLTREQVYAGVSRLRDKNLACRVGYAKYDITKRGRRMFDELFFTKEPTPWDA